jgi:hypothetical protein
LQRFYQRFSAFQNTELSNSLSPPAEPGVYQWNYYGKKWGIPWYAPGTLVSVSRIEKGRHWSGDAVAAAALGYIAGRTAIGVTKRELAGRKPLSGFMIMPVCGYGQRGISVRLSYSCPPQHKYPSPC